MKLSTTQNYQRATANRSTEVDEKTEKFAKIHLTKITTTDVSQWWTIATRLPETRATAQ